MGIILSYVKRILDVIAGLIYLPIILHFLSVEEYGLYQIVASLIAYLAIMDLGLSGTITRYYSQKLALNDEKGKEHVIAISLGIYLVIALLILLVGAGFYGLMNHLYGNTLSAAEIASAKKMLVILVIDVAVMIPGRIFSSLLTSHERFVFLRSITIIRSLLQPVLAALLLSANPAAFSLVIVQVILDFIIIIATMIYSFRSLNLRIRLQKPDPELTKSMLKFSFFLLIYVIVEQIYWGTGKVVLGAVVGTAAVAIFSLAIQINMFARLFASAIISVMLPKVTRIATISSDMCEINQIFRKVGRAQYFVIGLMVTGFILFGKGFIQLWVGAEFQDAYVMTLIIMIPYAIDLTINIGTTILQAKNLHSRQSVILSISACLTIILSIPLSRLYGGIGAAVALGFSFFAGNGVASLVYYAKVGIDVRTFSKELLPAIGSTILALLVGYGLVKVISPRSWVSMAEGIIIYSIMYLVFSWFLSIKKEERATVKNYIIQMKK